MTRKNGSARGFTLIELLVVITIIGLLAAILIPAVAKALNSAKKTRALTQIQDLDGALKRYFSEYGKMPVPVGQNGGPDRVFKDLNQAAIVEVLIGANTNLNPKKIVFLDLDPASFGKPTVVEMLAALKKGPYADPWGGGYVIMLDLNFDEKIADFGFGEIRAKTAVYSYGEVSNSATPQFKTW